MLQTGQYPSTQTALRKHHTLAKLSITEYHRLQMPLTKFGYMSYQTAPGGVIYCSLAVFKIYKCHCIVFQMPTLEIYCVILY